MSIPAGEGPTPRGTLADATTAVGGATRSVAARLARLPLTWVAVVFAVAQLADLVTAWGVTRELNPIAAALASLPGAGFVVKVGLIVFVIAVARICDRRRPVLARLLLAFGALAGLAGAITNTHLTPFVG